MRRWPLPFQPTLRFPFSVCVLAKWGHCFATIGLSEGKVKFNKSFKITFTRTFVMRAELYDYQYFLTSVISAKSMAFVMICLILYVVGGWMLFCCIIGMGENFLEAATY